MTICNFPKPYGGLQMPFKGLVSVVLSADRWPLKPSNISKGLWNAFTYPLKAFKGSLKRSLKASFKTTRDSLPVVVSEGDYFCSSPLLPSVMLNFSAYHLMEVCTCKCAWRVTMPRLEHLFSYTKMMEFQGGQGRINESSRT